MESEDSARTTKLTMNTKALAILGIALGIGFLSYLALSNSPKKIDDVLGESTTPTEQNNAVKTPKEELNMKQYKLQPELGLIPQKDYRAVLKTSKGDIKIDLYEKKTPVTVNNFVFLAKDGFYDNTKFHRIIKGFMIQGGDPLGNGTGGPGYKFNDEIFDGDYTRGTIAMANAGPNTNGSQFFIMHKDMGLPKDYVIFGKVTDADSLAVVDKIAETPVKQGAFGNEMSTPTEDVTIQSIEILVL